MEKGLRDLWKELFGDSEDIEVVRNLDIGDVGFTCRVCRGCGSLVSMESTGEESGDSWDHVGFHVLLGRLYGR